MGTWWYVSPLWHHKILTNSYRKDSSVVTFIQLVISYWAGKMERISSIRSMLFIMVGCRTCCIIHTYCYHLYVCCKSGDFSDRLRWHTCMVLTHEHTCTHKRKKRKNKRKKQKYCFKLSWSTYCFGNMCIWWWQPGFSYMQQCSSYLFLLFLLEFLLLLSLSRQWCIMTTMKRTARPFYRC